MPDRQAGLDNVFLTVPRYPEKCNLARGIVLYFTILGGRALFVKYKNSPAFFRSLFTEAKIFVDKTPCPRLKGGLCEKKYEPWPGQ
jgi:hypothetical protein